MVSSTTPACFLRHVEVDRRRCRSDDPPSLRRDGTRRGLHRAGACISRSLPRHSLKLDNITKKNICIATGPFRTSDLIGDRSIARHAQPRRHAAARGSCSDPAGACGGASCCICGMPMSRPAGSASLAARARQNLPPMTKLQI